MEVVSLNMALNIMNEAFLMNGNSHPNMLPFSGCYFSEFKADHQSGEDLEEEEKDVSENKEKSKKFDSFY